MADKAPHVNLIVVRASLRSQPGPSAFCTLSAQNRVLALQSVLCVQDADGVGLDLRGALRRQGVSLPSRNSHNLHSLHWTLIAITVATGTATTTCIAAAIGASAPIDAIPDEGDVDSATKQSRILSRW